MKLYTYWRSQASFRILDACMQIEAFALEHPLRQPGAQTAASV
jgi:hypothetical protein